MFDRDYQDHRPKRVKKPNKWLVIVTLCTLACFPIPLITLFTLPFGVFLTIKQYKQAFKDDKVPYGHFYGEDNSPQLPIPSRTPGWRGLFED